MGMKKCPPPVRAGGLFMLRLECKPVSALCALTLCPVFLLVVVCFQLIALR